MTRLLGRLWFRNRIHVLFQEAVQSGQLWIGVSLFQYFAQLETDQNACL